MTKKMKIRIELMKRILSIVIPLFMILGSPIIANAKYFTDISYYNQEYIDAINFASDNGYMNGTYTNKFSPTGTMTRAMFVTVLYNMAGTPPMNNTISFSDVATDAWYYNSVRWAYNKGLISGYTNGTFRPNNQIAKQDASLILYKYALQKGLTVDKQDSLDTYPDKNNVTSYALTAVKWAVATGVYPNADGTSLEPSTYFTRADMALMITRFGTSVEFIEFGRDNYQFANIISNFSSPYYINEEHYNRLKTYVEDYYGTVKSQGIMYYIDQNKNHSFGGACYGMAVTTILDKLGKIDFNGNFASNAKNMYDVQLEKGSDTESAINYYHLSQHIDFLNWRDDKYITSPFNDQLEYAVEDMAENKGLSLFLYHAENKLGGHAIVAYDMKQVGNLYKATAYDNRYPNIPLTIEIDKNQGTCYIKKTGAADQKVTSLVIYTDFTAFDNIDIDGLTNMNNNYNAIEDEDTQILFIDLTGDFTITNTEGESLTWTNYLYGDMEIIDSSIIINGSDVPSTLCLCVKSSDDLVITPLTEETNIVKYSCYCYR